MTGRSVDDYRAPLFLAWQLTNRCAGACVGCCEESGPGGAWAAELDREEALRLARDIVAFRIPYVAFGGGEPMGVSHFWDILATLSAAGTASKIETDGLAIDESAAERLQDLAVQCVQVSVDGATRGTYERVRGYDGFEPALSALERLGGRSVPAELVFVPNRINVHEAGAAYDLAVTLGCRAFVTGPMMRLGRAARAWRDLAISACEWQQTVRALEERAAAHGHAVRLLIYPWDILTEMRHRLQSPQSMLLVVPDGKVKLLNALPFAPADLRHSTLEEAWRAYREAWRSRDVRDFVAACEADPELLRHANETWPMGARAGLRMSRGRPPTGG